MHIYEEIWTKRERERDQSVSIATTGI